MLLWQQLFHNMSTLLATTMNFSKKMFSSKIAASFFANLASKNKQYHTQNWLLSDQNIKGYFNHYEIVTTINPIHPGLILGGCLGPGGGGGSLVESARGHHYVIMMS